MIGRATAAGLALILAAPVGRADMTVTGSATYVDRVHAFTGWTGAESQEPVRLAVVDVIDAADGSILGTGSTDGSGSFQIDVAGAGSRDLIVRVYTLCDSLDPEEVSVRSDAIGGPLYSVSSAVQAGVDLSLDLDVGTLVAGKLTIAGQQGNPFDIFDAAVRVVEFVASHDLPVVTLPLGAVYPSPSGSTGAGGPSYAYVAAGDGFDDTVVLHELGHIVDNRYDWIPSGGGSHSFGQSDLDPVLAFGEGFASYFAGAVKEFAGDPDPGYYFDGKGGTQTGLSSVALRVRFETRIPYANATAGEADEVAVCAALWDLHDGPGTADPLPGDDDLADGAGPFAGAPTGGELVIDGLHAISAPTAPGQTHVIDLFGALFTELGETDYAAVRDAFELQELRVSEDALEPASAGSPPPTVLVDGGWTPILTLYSTAESGPAPGIGDVDEFAFQTVPGRLYEVQTRYPGGAGDAETYCDPFLTVWSSSGELLGSDTDSGVGRNARVQVPSIGSETFIARVQAQTPARPTGSYQLRVRDVGPAVPPVVAGFTQDPMPTAIESWLPGNQVLGSGFTGATALTIGGIDAQHWVVGDGLIEFLLPPVDAVGPLPVAVTTPVGTAAGTLTVEPPASPTLFATTSYGVGNITLRVGTEPASIGVVLLSTTSLPTSLPGIADLDIGAAGTDLAAVLAFSTGDAGVFQLSTPYSSPAGGTVPVELQAIVIPPGSVGPWPVTNPTTLYLN